MSAEAYVSATKGWPRLFPIAVNWHGLPGYLTLRQFKADDFLIRSLHEELAAVTDEEFCPYLRARLTAGRSNLYIALCD